MTIPPVPTTESFMDIYRVEMINGDKFECPADSFAMTGPYVYLVREGKIVELFLNPRRMSVIQDMRLVEPEPEPEPDSVYGLTRERGYNLGEVKFTFS